MSSSIYLFRLIRQVFLLRYIIVTFIGFFAEIIKPDFEDNERSFKLAGGEKNIHLAVFIYRCTKKGKDFDIGKVPNRKKLLKSGRCCEIFHGNI